MQKIYCIYNAYIFVYYIIEKAFVKLYYFKRDFSVYAVPYDDVDKTLKKLKRFRGEFYWAAEAHFVNIIDAR